MSDAETVRVAAGLPDGAASAQLADEALGNALVGVVQDYLAREKNEWDVDLFFETYGRPPRDGNPWSPAIIAGLVSRPDIADADRAALIQGSRDRAGRRLRSQA